MERRVRKGIGVVDPAGWDVSDGFDVRSFLDHPHVARLATSGTGGPRVRPIWYLFDDDGFWWLTGTWSVLPRTLARDPQVEILVDTCDLASGEVLQVRAGGRAEVRPFDADRARRWGERYLGSDRSRWGRFGKDVFEDAGTRFVLLAPAYLRGRDLSWG
jgi:hypothetical protein